MFAGRCPITTARRLPGTGSLARSWRFWRPVRSSSTRAATVEQRRPNILFIFSDDHAYQAISAYGDPRRLIETPNIDRLAREGMRFDRCLVPNSICGPSRATVLTGKYSHCQRLLQQHQQPLRRLADDLSQAAAGGGLSDGDLRQVAPGDRPDRLRRVADPAGPGRLLQPADDHAGGRKVQHQGYVTDIITELSLEWLKQRDRSRPFLLMCQHKAPHREWEPPLRYLGHDHDRIYPEPPTLFDDYAGRGKAEHAQDMTIARTLTDKDLKLVSPPELTAEQREVWNAYYEPRNAAFRAANLQGKDLVRWKYNRYLHDYLGCIKAVDESVGRLLALPRPRELADNTIVVYAADQGFFLGEHGWFDKRWIFEESLRAPLLVRWPGWSNPAATPTGSSRTSISPRRFSRRPDCRFLPRCKGEAWCRCSRGQVPADWRTSFYYHYYEYPWSPQCSPPLRRGDGPLQACPFLRAGGERVGIVRSQDRSARAPQRLRSGRTPDGQAGAGRGNSCGFGAAFGFLSPTRRRP